MTHRFASLFVRLLRYATRCIALSWMNRHRVAGVVLLLGIRAGPAFPGEAEEQRVPIPSPWVELEWRGMVIHAEVAADPLSRSRGLMARGSLAEDSGMLFVFERKGRHCFWMKGTPLPLSVAFLADDGTVVGVADMEPLSRKPHCSPQPIGYALEMDRGWFALQDIDRGSRLTHPRLFRNDEP